MVEALLALVILALWLVASVFVYRHAEDNGHTGILWAMIVFLFGIPGLVVYGIVHLLADN